MLENRVWKIIKDNVSYHYLETRYPIQYKNIRDETVRGEIDLVFGMGNKNFILECKRTDFVWLFPKPVERIKKFNLMYYDFRPNGGLKSKTQSTIDFKITWNDIPFMFKSDSKRLFIKKVDGVDYVKTCRRDVHDHLIQVLKETDAFLSTELFRTIKQKKMMEIKELSGTNMIMNPNELIIPMIVTNTELYYLDYEESHLNSDGDLTDYTSIKAIDGIVYNFSDIPINTTEKQIDSTRSIFITNVNQLKKFIHLILDQDV